MSNGFTVLRERVRPLNWAAYAACAMVWLNVELTAVDAAGLWMQRLGLAGFVGGFVVLAESAVDRPGRVRLAISLAMLLCAWLVLAAHASGTSPTLLVVLAVVLAAQHPLRTLLLWLLAVNAGFALIAGFSWQLRGMALWVPLAAYASFQALAVLLMRATRSAEGMAAELRAANAELLTTRALLAEAARDAERLRLSRELHDVAGHGLTALKLNLAVLARDARQPDRERVTLCADLADELLHSLRSLVQHLRVQPGIELAPALARLGLAFPRPQLHCHIAAELQVESRSVLEVLLRTVQEALTNAARHSAAKVLNVDLQQRAECLQLLIDDDGQLAALPQPGGGLRGMRERIEQLGGHWALARSPLGGLRVQAELPLTAAAP